MKIDEPLFPPCSPTELAFWPTLPGPVKQRALQADALDPELNLTVSQFAEIYERWSSMRLKEGTIDIDDFIFHGIINMKNGKYFLP